MSSRNASLLILALALAFVSLWLMRAGVVAHIWRGGDSTGVAGAAAAADSTNISLAILDSTLVWIGAPPRGTLDSAATVIVAWTLSEPRSLAAITRAQQWQDLYGGKGVGVVGVYAPRFTFDADSGVAAREMRRLGLRMPMAIDARLTFTDRLAPGGALPRILVTGPDGTVDANTGEVAAAERAIESAVVALHPELGSGGDASRPPPPGVTSTAAHAPVYLGASRARLGPLADVTPGAPRLFHAEFRSDIEGAAFIPYPVGMWSLEADGLRAARGGAQTYVALRYSGGPLAVVASPAGHATRLWVLRDDAWLPRAALGADAALDGRGASYVDVTAPRLYDVCRDDGHAHTVKLSPVDPGFMLHGFVFESVTPPDTPRP